MGWPLKGANQFLTESRNNSTDVVPGRGLHLERFQNDLFRSIFLVGNDQSQASSPGTWANDLIIWVLVFHLNDRDDYT